MKFGMAIGFYALSLQRERFFQFYAKHSPVCQAGRMTAARNNPAAALIILPVSKRGLRNEVSERSLPPQLTDVVTDLRKSLFPVSAERKQASGMTDYDWRFWLIGAGMSEPQ
ncbi:MAG: hypothetical protein D4R65_10150 [Verrucomicrobiaceae bacterium]|nr:MAG: hypothetical protein D4R65_10150 [Verrucomicrobiaceae bacterium]